MWARRAVITASLLLIVHTACNRPREMAKPQQAGGEGEVTVLYDADGGKPAPLTDEQKREIINDVSPFCPQGQRIWFIRVHRNEPLDVSSVKLEHDVTVYFTPEVTTPRLRKGTRIGFWSAWWTMDPGGKADFLRKLVGTYYQVSLRDKPFGGGLEIPPSTLMPYRSKTNLSDDEVVEIVDFLRTNPTDEEGNAFDGSRPIKSINGKDDVIEIWTVLAESSAHDPGGGGIIELKKTPEGFRVVRISWWVT